MSILLIFRKEFIASMPRRTSKAPQNEATPPSSDTVGPTTARHSGYRRPVIVVRSARQATPSDWRLPLDVMAMLCTGLIRLVAGLERRTEAGLRKIKAVLLSTASWIAPYLRAGARWGVQTGKHLWNVTRPYLQEFDHWLERKVSRNRPASEFLEILGECLKLIPSTIRKLERYARKLP